MHFHFRYYFLFISFSIHFVFSIFLNFLVPTTSSSSKANFAVLPHAGQSVTQIWTNNSTLAVDHAAAGSFDTAMRVRKWGEKDGGREREREGERERERKKNYSSILTNNFLVIERTSWSR